MKALKSSKKKLPGKIMPLKYLTTFSNLRYYTYPFPTGRLYIFGDKDSIKITVDGILNNTITNKEMEHKNNNIFNIILENSGQPFPKKIYDYKITAKDRHGHETVKTGQFQII